MSASHECCGWTAWAEMAGIDVDGRPIDSAAVARPARAGGDMNGTHDAPMKIGELAHRAGVNIQTVRYYERRGLLPPPARRPSGYREYGPDALERLRFIKGAKELGFTLAEVRELLELRLDPRTPAAAVKARAEAKITDIDRKLHDLERIRHALVHLAGRCRGGRGPVGDCPLLDALGHVDTARLTASGGRR